MISVSQKLEHIEHILEINLAESFLVNNDGVVISVKIPFEFEGDPLHVYIEHDYDKFSVNDGGYVAGLLFSLDHHEENSELLRITEYLCRIWDVSIDYSNGILVKYNIDINNLYDKIFDFTRIIVTLFTVAPFIKYGRL